MVEIRRRPLPRHGTDHDLKPPPSFPRFCIPARPLQCRQEVSKWPCDRTIAAACAILWSLGLSLVAENGSTSIATYAWCGMGAAALTAWGIRDARVERINLGIAGFGITVFAFYFSNVLDRLGRSASLMGAGLLFLIGGWLLQRTRRELISRIRPEAV